MKRILIIKVGALGDVARSTVMLSAIRQRFPQARVTWVAGKAAAQLLALLHDPPEILPLDESSLLCGTFRQKVHAVLDINRRLAGRIFDLALVPYHNRLYHALRLGAWTWEVRDFRPRRGMIAGRSQCAEYARLIWQQDDCTLPQPAFPPLDQSKLPVMAGAPQVLLSPGGGNILVAGVMRRWPLEHYVELARRLLLQGISVGIIGGCRAEVDMAAFAGLSIHDYVGKTTVAELLGLLRGAQVLVSHDTGPMHCMNMLGGNIVGLFGPTLASEMLAKGPHINILSAPTSLPCCPCYDGKNFADCTDPQCLWQIDVDRVLRATTAFMASYPSAQT